jgi:hypothetical protein
MMADTIRAASAASATASWSRDSHSDIVNLKPGLS